MAAPLSVASVIEKNRLSSDVAFLVCLDIAVKDPSTGGLVETLYLVRNSESIVWNGHTYQPVPFDIELKEESGVLQSVTLSITDYSRMVMQRMQLYGGGVGFTVTVSVVNAGNLGQGPEVQEFFEVVGAEANAYVCAFTLGAENAIAHSFPRRKQTKDYCQWRYKGPECAYAGAMPSCDLSLKGPNGCEAHNNAPRFGAFRGLNTRDVVQGG
jgi:phage-related protein